MINDPDAAMTPRSYEVGIALAPLFMAANLGQLDCGAFLVVSGQE